MKNINTTPGIGTDPDFLNGNLVDIQTLLNTTILQDIVQFFQKLKAKAGLTENGNFDNEVNGYQTVEALDKRNHATKSRSYVFDYYIDYPISIGNTRDIPYPYSENFNFAKFTGIWSFQINGVQQVADIVKISSATDLPTGLVLYESGTFRITAYPGKFTINNYNGAGILSNINLSVLIQGHIV